MKKLWALLVILQSVIFFAPEIGYGEDELDRAYFESRDSDVLRFDSPMYSPDGKFLVLSDEHHNGVYLYDTLQKTYVEIANSPSSGYAYNWSPDSKNIGFKLLISNGENTFPLQLPVVFCTESQQLTALHPLVPRSGVPSFSDTGLIAFTPAPHHASRPG